MDEILRSEQELFRNLALTIVLILLCFLAISKLLFPKLFASVYDYRKLFSFKPTEDFGAGIQLLSTESIHFTGLMSAMLGFVLLNVAQSIPDAFPEILLVKSFSGGLLLWLLMSLAVFVLLLFKYVFTAVVGLLFDLKQPKTRHFQEVLSLNHLFTGLLFLSFIIALFSRFYLPSTLAQTILVATSIYLLYRLISLFFKIRRHTESSMLYIFSYLCTTEIFPLAIGIIVLIQPI